MFNAVPMPSSFVRFGSFNKETNAPKYKVAVGGASVPPPDGGDDNKNKLCQSYGDYKNNSFSAKDLIGRNLVKYNNFDASKNTKNI